MLLLRPFYSMEQLEIQLAANLVQFRTEDVKDLWFTRDYRHGGWLFFVCHQVKDCKPSTVVGLEVF